MSNLLEVRNLSVSVKHKKEKKILLDGLSFSLAEGECLGILGESGSGKSMTAKSILGLLDNNFEVGGQALYQGRDLLKESKEGLRVIRGKEISMVLQNPMTSFDPLYKVGNQIGETLLAHDYIDKRAIRDFSIALLEQVKIREPEEVLEKYPHQLSGGMLQRIMIGLAIAMEPKLLIADEPTTAIDAITQYEIMNEFKRIKGQHGMAMIFISHDLGAISSVADRVIVLNDGVMVDQGDFKDIVEKAQDPYTRLLIDKRRAVMQRYRSYIKKEEGVGQDD